VSKIPKREERQIQKTREGNRKKEKAFSLEKDRGKQGERERETGRATKKE